jgi:hypothetical protein
LIDWEFEEAQAENVMTNQAEKAMKINRVFIGVVLFATAFGAWAAAGCPLGCC